MTWVLTIAGIAALIVIHEGGHAIAALLVGMKVERFALFFPPILLKKRIGSTEFALGTIPLGGYVRITGQNPIEDVAQEDEDLSYANKAIWKRAFVIAAGPAANLVTCLVLVTVLLMVSGQQTPTSRISPNALQVPALGSLKAGDRIVSVDGVKGGPEAFVKQTRTHRCASVPIAGCLATDAAALVVVRNGQSQRLLLFPRYDAKAKAMRLGFAFATDRQELPFSEAARTSVSASWQVSKATLKAISGVVDSKQRSQLGGIVGGVAVTEEAFSQDLVNALELLAFISLSIALVNLLPILPLDGGHLLWLLIEKLRGRPASTETLERAALIGFGLVAVLFVIGLSNDIGRLGAGGFSQPH
ncbi:MAG: site-2 protease family protein [Solirubrobacterales bacterium]|nr:site-2 protease family protein [Solirubrobacterales bacterium]